MNAVIFKKGDVTIAFTKEVAAAKTLAEFKLHEAHHGLTDAEYKQIHDACCNKIAKAPKKDEADKA